MDISLSEIAGRLGVSYKTVQRVVADLKKMGVLKESEEKEKGKDLIVISLSGIEELSGQDSTQVDMENSTEFTMQVKVFLVKNEI